MALLALPRVSDVASTAPLGGHLWHILLLAGWFPIYAVMVLVDRARGRRATTAASTSAAHVTSPFGTLMRGPVRHRTAVSLQVVALASMSAALIHVAVMPDHFEQSVWYGSFFLCAAVAQMAFAVTVLVRPTRQMMKAGVAGCVLIVVLWLVTRTVGVPIGPDNGATEPFGILDVMASCAEVAVVLAGLTALRGWQGEPSWRWSSWSMPMRLFGTGVIAGTVVLSLVASRS